MIVNYSRKITRNGEIWQSFGTKYKTHVEITDVQEFSTGMRNGPGW